MEKRLNFDWDDFNGWYMVTTKKDILGYITKNHWNRWTWEQEEDIIMSRGCLKELVAFMETLGGKD